MFRIPLIYEHIRSTPILWILCKIFFLFQVLQIKTEFILSFASTVSGSTLQLLTDTVDSGTNYSFRIAIVHNYYHCKVHYTLTKFIYLECHSTNELWKVTHVPSLNSRIVLETELSLNALEGIIHMILNWWGNTKLNLEKGPMDQGRVRPFDPCVTRTTR